MSRIAPIKTCVGQRSMRPRAQPDRGPGVGMMAADDVVLLLDVNNALLDNDRVQDVLRKHLEREFGAASRYLYGAIFEALRSELGNPDYLGVLQRHRCAEGSGAMDVSRLPVMSSFLVDYPFADQLYPEVLDAVAHLRNWDLTVTLFNGDVVFHPRKVQSSGLSQAVEGRVLIYIHKDQLLVELEQRYPARHYVMVDDKLRNLAGMKDILPDRPDAVFARQGHYALDSHNRSTYPPADLAIGNIGDLLRCDCAALV
jgi:hypothetical protein